MRLLSIVLAPLAFVPFVACGGGSPQPSTPPAATTPTAPASESPAPTTSTEPTSSSDSAVPASTTTSAPGPLPMVAFQIVATDGKKNVLYDVKADGSILDDKGAKVGSIDGHKITLSDGEPVWTVDDDGSVHGALFPTAKAKFDDKNVLVIEEGKVKATVTVDDAGNVTALGPKGKDPMPWKVVGDVAKAKRCAALLSLTIARPKQK